MTNDLENLEISAAQIMAARKQALADIAPRLTKKLLYGLQEKLAAENKLLLEFVQKKSSSEQQAAKYSFVLDQRYFEQKFLS